MYRFLQHYNSGCLLFDWKLNLTDSLEFFVPLTRKWNQNTCSGRVKCISSCSLIAILFQKKVSKKIKIKKQKNNPFGTKIISVLMLIVMLMSVCLDYYETFYAKIKKILNVLFFKKILLFKPRKIIKWKPFSDGFRIFLFSIRMCPPLAKAILSIFLFSPVESH